MSLALVKFLIGCKHFKGLCAENFGGKKSLAHLWLSREAKVVQSYGEFLTRQNFWPIFNNLSGLSLAGPPPGRAVSRLRVQRYGDLFTSTKFFGHFFSKKPTFFGFFGLHLIIYNKNATGRHEKSLAEARLGLCICDVLSMLLDKTDGSVGVILKAVDAY